MVAPGVILPYLASMFNVSTPKHVVGAKLPKNILAVYDGDTNTIYFRDIDPSIPVITHEFGHHLHTVYGIRLSRGELERVANEVERRLSEFYGVEPLTYGSVPNDAINRILLISGVLMILCGVFIR